MPILLPPPPTTSQQTIVDDNNKMSREWAQWFFQVWAILSEAAISAPGVASYVVNTSDALLPNAQVLGNLGSGFVKVTTGSGLLTSTNNNTIQTVDIGNNQVTTAKLAITGVIPGDYGSSASTPAFQVGIDGRITSVSNIPIFAPPIGTAGGDLGGTYPNPTVDARFQNTGILTGGTLSIGTGGAGVATTFSLTSGTGIVVDNITTNVATAVTWATQTNIAIPGIASGALQYILINSSGTIVQQLTIPTDDQYRTHLFLGIIGTADLAHVTSAVTSPLLAYDIGPALYDLVNTLGVINNSGNVYSTFATDLRIQKTSGSIYKLGANFSTNPQIPSLSAQASLSPVPVIRIVSQTTVINASATGIDPNHYDVGGVSTVVPNNKWTLQYILTTTNNVTAIQLGQTVYPTAASAIAAIGIENFTFSPNSASLALRGFLIVQQGTTDLTNATFITAGKFGIGSSGPSGVSTTSLQQAYNNSISPEITTNAVLGALSVQRGSAADTDNVIEGANGAGTTTFSITGAGNITTGTWQGTTVAVTKGGTGLTTCTTGDLLLGSGSNTLATLPIGTVNFFLKSTGTTAVWAASTISTLDLVSYTYFGGV